MVPPDQVLPSFCRSQRIFRPTTGWPFLSPEQSSHLGLGFFGSGSISFWTFPKSLPFSSQMVTIDWTLPVTSSMVFQRPTGDVVGASAARRFGAPTAAHTTNTARIHRFISVLTVSDSLGDVIVTQNN